jgi:hypothetical protein
MLVLIHEMLSCPPFQVIENFQPQLFVRLDHLQALPHVAYQLPVDGVGKTEPEFVKESCSLPFMKVADECVIAAPQQQVLVPVVKD